MLWIPITPQAVERKTYSAPIHPGKGFDGRNPTRVTNWQKNRTVGHIQVNVLCPQPQTLNNVQPKPVENSCLKRTAALHRFKLGLPRTVLRLALPGRDPKTMSSSQVRARCSPVQPPHLPPRANQVTSLSWRQLIAPCRPSIRFLFIASQVSHSLPPPVGHPSEVGFW